MVNCDTKHDECQTLLNSCKDASIIIVLYTFALQIYKGLIDFGNNSLFKIFMVNAKLFQTIVKVGA